MTEWPKDTYVLVPSYKSAGHLKRFINTLTAVVPKEYILIVDDASRDGTYEFCAEQGINCIRHSVNKGKGAALRTGFAHLAENINTKWIVTMDADGQHSPADLPRFLSAARKPPAAGLIIGSRDMRLGAMPPARILSNRLTSLMLSILSGQWIKDSQCGYRMYSREFVASVQIKYNRFEMESEVILRAAAKKIPITFVRAQTLYLKEGSSHISHFIDTLRWVRAVSILWLGLKFKGKTNGKSGKNCVWR
ncbi:MAG: glycosyltransferase family 2 protein [Chitinispirillia bacterium]|nr:glycosyltransferase family 2 protein [Chitinispirillia bacterium]